MAMPVVVDRAGEHVEHEASAVSWAEVQPRYEAVIATLVITSTVLL